MEEFMTDGERSGPGRDKSASEVVLVTGASGFIAAALIARLGERYTVVGLDRAGPPDPPPPAAAIDIDVESDEAVQVALDEVRARYGNRIASVIHLAAYYDISGDRSEEHTSELQSLMRTPYAVFCLKQKTKRHKLTHKHQQHNDNH